MTLFEFLEAFDATSEVIILYYGNIEFQGKIKDVPFKEMVGKTVKLGEAVICDTTLLINVENEIKKHKSYSVVLTIDDNMQEDKQIFIKGEIKRYKEKFHITEKDGLFYAEEIEVMYDDIPRMLTFFMKMQKYKDYFKTIGYVSHSEGASEMITRKC